MFNTLASISMTDPEAVGFCRERLKRLDAVTQRAVDEKQYGGAVILLARHGKVVYFESAGEPKLGSEESPSEDAIFRIASMSKPITGVAMMLLYEEGKWSPADSICRFIPEFSSLKVYKDSNNSGAMRVEDPDHAPTLRELMTHTAGFSYGAGSDPVDRSYRDEKDRGILESGSLQAMIDRLAKAPLLCQPGSRWVYSVSTDIQGCIIERLSGMSLPEFLQKRLFEPLRMTDTGFHVPIEKRNRFATLYGMNRQGELICADTVPLPFLYDREPSLPSGGGGLVSTAADYFRFAQMLLNRGELDGVRLLAPASIQLMMSNHLPDNIDTKDRFTNCPRLGLGHGYNGAVVTDPGKADVPMGKGTYLWDGAFETWFWVDPIYDVAFVGMVQRQRQPGDQVGATAMELQELSRAVTYQALLKPAL